PGVPPATCNHVSRGCATPNVSASFSAAPLPTMTCQPSMSMLRYGCPLLLIAASYSRAYASACMGCDRTSHHRQAQCYVATDRRQFAWLLSQCETGQSTQNKGQAAAFELGTTHLRSTLSRCPTPGPNRRRTSDSRADRSAGSRSWTLLSGSFWNAAVPVRPWTRLPEQQS